MVIHLVRMVYLLVVLAFTTSYAFQGPVYRQGPLYATLYILLPTLGAFGLVLVDMFWRRKHLQVLSGLFFGLLAGLVIAHVMGIIIDLVGDVFLGSTGGVQTVEFVAPPRPTNSNVEIASETTAQPITAAPQEIDALKKDIQALNDRLDTIQASSRQETPPATFASDRPTPIRDLLKVLLGVSAVFLCVSFVLQTKDDFRFVIPYVEFAKQTKGGRPILLDTSVIIDGRISDIIETQIIDSPVIVPRFVLQELQAVADSDDKLKRNRGRRGLDILNRLRESPKMDIQILDVHVSPVDEAPDVDSKLIALAQHLNGRVVTNDYNLNKIAQLRGVDVININDLANAVKPVVLPGEMMKVRIIKPGEEAGQGIGYLEDGTMIVVEQARDQINQEVSLVVTSVLQTSAGRMIFGRAGSERNSHGQGKTRGPGNSQRPDKS